MIKKLFHNCCPSKSKNSLILAKLMSSPELQSNSRAISNKKLDSPRILLCKIQGMTTCYIYCALVSFILLPNQPAHAGERDPFMPYQAERSKPKLGVSVSSLGASLALTEHPLGTLKLVGVIISPHQSFAIMQSRDGRDYFVSKGDKVGSEGGVLMDISPENVAIRLNKNTVELAVSNKIKKKANEQN